MAKVVITVRDVGRGIDVKCRVEPEDKDSKEVQKVASSIAVGIAGVVTEIIRKSLNEKEHSNVH